MRTLVVSDLHLGTRAELDVLRREPVLDVLVGAAAACDRLVLLGDVIELRQGPLRDALAAAEPVLRRLGAAVGADGEVVIVAGNHDHNLVEPWLERRGRKGAPPPLRLESHVDWRAGEPLAALARWLAPAQVRAAYPGVWLSEEVYATHGHYCDRHTTVPMFERLGAGAMARIVREPRAGPHSTEDYEAVLAPLYAWVHAIAQHGGPQFAESSHGPSARAWRVLAHGVRRRSLRERMLVAAFPVVVAALNRAHLGPLRADISGAELRRAGLRGFAEVLGRLDVRAAHVIFGHTHRAGPLPGEDRGEWRTPQGSELLNSGCWVHEPRYLGENPSRSPYRPGFAVTLEDGGEPRLLNLLEAS